MISGMAGAAASVSEAIPISGRAGAPRRIVIHDYAGYPFAVQLSRWLACQGHTVLYLYSEDFLPILGLKGVHHRRSTVIENWAPLDDITPQPKDNPWTRAHGVADKFVFLCAGTVGLKHNPAHLANLARAFAADLEVRVVVVSQGPGRLYLERVKASEGLDNLILLDYQPFDRLSQVLSAADVAVLLLENFASELSVPSKVYSYMCVGRPIVGAIPATNLACRIVERERAGLTVAPGDEAGFVAAARRLRADPALCRALVDRQRAYALASFNIDRVGGLFSGAIEEVIGDAVANRSKGR